MTLSGLNCLVTGANTGLGLAVSKRLAREGASTILACRNEVRGENAVQEIRNESPNATLDLMICDLSSLQSIHHFIEDFKNKYTTLDLLYNNAAVMKRKRTITEDGFETMFQVNYLAPFILMNAFHELIESSTLHHVLNNGRPADDLRLDFDDLQFAKKYSMYNSFFKTKLCLLFSSLEMSRRHAYDSLTVTMADPGPFKSNLVRDVPLVGWFKNLVSAPVDTAADNILFVVKLDEEQKKASKVFEKREEKQLTHYWQDTTVSERLWSITGALLEEHPIYQSINFERMAERSLI